MAARYRRATQGAPQGTVALETRPMDLSKLTPNDAAVTLRGLERRYRALIADRDLDQVEVVATAAVRDARNGAEFLQQVRDLGFLAARDVALGVRSQADAVRKERDGQFV